MLCHPGFLPRQQVVSGARGAECSYSGSWQWKELPSVRETDRLLWVIARGCSIAWVVKILSDRIQNWVVVKLQGDKLQENELS